MSQPAAETPLLGQPEALDALLAGPSEGTSVASTLSAEETVVLSSVGWEPVGVSYGAAMATIPWGVDVGTGEPVRITEAIDEAFSSAASSCRNRCGDLGAEGALDVVVTLTVEDRTVSVSLVGTAVAPATERDGPRPRRPFLATLSAQDFALLQRANWRPLDIALTSAYAGIPARSLGDAVRGRLRGAEQEAASAALAFARELALARAERLIARRRGKGIVGLQVTEQAAPGRRYLVEFRVVGTIIGLRRGGHRTLGVRTVLGLDDRVRAFAAEALRGTARSDP